MGRWSRPIAAKFVDWLAVPRGLDWLEIALRTGALTEVILARGDPRDLVDVEPSAAFVARARDGCPTRGWSSGGRCREPCHPAGRKP